MFTGLGGWQLLVCSAGVVDLSVLANVGCFFTRITPLANSAAMSLCLASLLTIYLRFACLACRQNPVFWRRGTQRGVSQKRNQAVRVKSLRDCPKQVGRCWDFAPNRHSSRDLQRHIVGYREAKFRRWIESEPTSDRLEVGHQRKRVERVSVDDLASMEELRGNRNGIPPGSIYAKCRRASHHPMRNFATMGLLVRQTISRKVSKCEVKCCCDQQAIS